MRVFDRYEGYGFVHHRALNTLAKRDRALTAARRHSEATHIFEGDVCWNFSGRDAQLYFRHPRAVFDTLSTRQVNDALVAGEITDLSALDAVAEAGAFAVCELKLGRGDWRAAIDKLVAGLADRFEGRFWVDSFSPQLLAHVKSRHPGVTTTLHTECVIGGRVLVGAPEWPPIRIRRIGDLAMADGIAVRWHGTAGYMEQAARHVREAGKTLVMSCLTRPERYQRSRTWKARAGYVSDNIATLLRLNGEPSGSEPTASDE